MIFAFSAFLVFLAIGTPIVFVLGIAATLTLLLIQPEIPVTIVTQRIYDGLNSFTIMAIPFFVFAGAIMDAGGISRRIVDFASALVGWIVGSLLMVSVVAATGLAAISGSGSADVAAISAIMQPELRRRKYDIDFSAAVIACAGSLAQIIPPSLMMVVVALVSNLSVGAMFLAGVLPGLMTVPGILATAYIHARRGGPQYREVEPFSLARVNRTFWAGVPALGMPVIIIGGIIGGIFTPTEAAAVAVAYGLLIALFVYRDLKFQDITGLILRAAALSAAVMTIIGTASIFGWLVASANVPALLAAWIKTISSEPWTYLLLVNVLLMLIGMFMESLAAILILVPVLMPIAIDFGINPVHFGLVVVMNFAIGMVTPPYGITLFVASSVAERDIIQVARKIFWPWLMMTLILLLVTFVPEIGLFLPRLAGLL
ncbi:MAG: TRAP transporter large permease [Rhodospirillales bacterium]|nr:TRAP transporter large permease [Rhodospirillales bacterium]MDP7652977.1 TRAP transporter large permease [Rhodospirillales bacterium]HJO97660.1 TRAP transporter large permease [Rhodospirillales bacterium]